MTMLLGNNLTTRLETLKVFLCYLKSMWRELFRNLRVDPADGLKFGNKWQNSYYLDPAIAFRWVHGSTSFQICSDAVAYI